MAVSAWERARATSTVTSSSRQAMSSSARRDLPIPASPAMVTNAGVPVAVACARHSRRIVSSLDRPTSGIVRRAERVVIPSTGYAGRSSVNPLARMFRSDSERDLGLGERVRGLSREHLSGAGGRLEPGRGVHDGSGDEELSGRPHSRRGDAGFDADANPERLRESERAAQTTESAADRQAGAHRAERVVLVDRRESEHRHHGVADELLRTPSERLQLLGRGVEERAQDLAGALGVETLPETGGIDEVGEEHGDHLAFLGAERGRHHRPAVGAETRAGRERMAADRTIHPRSIGRVPDARMPHRGG